MSATTVSFLVTRLIKADRRWSEAMDRPGYRDDPDEAQEEGSPFTERDWELYGFADAWRAAVHAIEADLFSIPHYRQFWVDSHSDQDEETFFVDETSVAELVGATDAPEADESDPPPTAQRPSQNRTKPTR